MNSFATSDNTTTCCSTKYTEWRDEMDTAIWEILLSRVRAQLRSSTSEECYAKALELQMLARSEVSQRSRRLFGSMEPMAVGQPVLEASTAEHGESFVPISPIKPSRNGNATKLLRTGRHSSKQAYPPHVAKYFSPTIAAVTNYPYHLRPFDVAQIQTVPAPLQETNYLPVYPPPTMGDSQNSSIPSQVAAKLQPRPVERSLSLDIDAAAELPQLPPLPPLPMTEFQASPSTFQVENGAGTLVSMRNSHPGAQSGGSCGQIVPGVGNQYYTGPPANKGPMKVSSRRTEIRAPKSRKQTKGTLKKVRSKPGKKAGRVKQVLIRAVCSPSEFDVLAGRGALTNRNVGNSFFRDEARKLRSVYRRTCKEEKHLIAEELVAKVSDQGGRFLEQGDDSLWYEMNDRRVMLKAKQALRENKWN